MNCRPMPNGRSAPRWLLRSRAGEPAGLRDLTNEELSDQTAGDDKEYVYAGKATRDEWHSQAICADTRDYEALSGHHARCASPQHAR
jgi:hypothetical protein